MSNTRESFNRTWNPAFYVLIQSYLIKNQLILTIDFDTFIMKDLAILVQKNSNFDPEKAICLKNCQF